MSSKAAAADDSGGGGAKEPGCLRLTTRKVPENASVKDKSGKGWLLHFSLTSFLRKSPKHQWHTHSRVPCRTPEPWQQLGASES
jgi:hypothetical protein